MAHRVPGGWSEGGPYGSPRDEAGQTPGAWASASGLTGLWPHSPHSTFTRQPRLPGLVPVLPLLTHFADINTFMVQQVVKFTKDRPVYRCVASPCLSGRKRSRKL